MMSSFAVVQTGPYLQDWIDIT